MSPQYTHLTRRQFLRGLGGAALTAGAPGLLSACGGGAVNEPKTGATATQTVFKEPTTRLSGDLRILQWSHFVPRHDEWFDPFAKDWGRRVGVTVTVDHINNADLPSRMSAEISAGQGHDLIETISLPSSFEPALLDLSDVVQEAERRHGKQIGFCTRTSFNPTTRKFYGFCHGWAPDPGDYRRSMWTRVGLPNGPSTWQELLDGGRRIRAEQNVRMGIGMSNEIDSNMAARALIWSFGGSIQDERENVVFNSPATVEAVEYMARLFRETMSDEVFAWNAASNNQGLIAGQLSYILNSISAYRTAQNVSPEVADDVFFTPALRGPRGTGLACPHAILIYAVPRFARNPDAAKEFLLHLVGNYAQDTYNSELYNFPAFPGTVPQLGGWLASDPFGSRPPDKLAFLKDAEAWTTNIGHPGPANAAIGEVFGTFVIPNMMAKAARGQLSPAAAVAEAEAQIKTIFNKWRAQRLVGGSS